jgi:hypothetical protein
VLLRPYLSLSIFGGLLMGLGAACFEDPVGGEGGCQEGSENCACFQNDTCLGTFECVNGLCVADAGETVGDGDGDGDGDGETVGDGDGDGDNGDGDGDDPGPTWCDGQGGNVILCYDFDADDPTGTLNPIQQNASLAISEAESASPPRSLQIVTVGDDMLVSEASIGHIIAGGPMPFAGGFSAQLWFDSTCFTNTERSVAALQFIDIDNVNGPFMLNLTIWATSTYVKLYASTEGMGFPSVPYQFDFQFPVQEWIDVGIQFAANQSVVNLTLGQLEQEIPVAEITQEVLQEIVEIDPAFLIGTSTAAGTPGCQMYVDNVIAYAG